MMSNESTLTTMVNNKTTKFINKIWGFANKIEGEAALKLVNLMRYGEHNNYKIQPKQTKETKVDVSRAKKLNWPNVDSETARELRTYIETATFNEIMGSTKHRRKKMK